jgi:hypothetical protein
MSWSLVRDGLCPPSLAAGEGVPGLCVLLPKRMMERRGCGS